MQELVLYHSYTTVFCAHTFVHPHICTHTHAQRIHNGSFANILLDFVQPKVQCLCLQCSQKCGLLLGSLSPVHISIFDFFPLAFDILVLGAQDLIGDRCKNSSATVSGRFTCFMTLYQKCHHSAGT